MALLPQDPAGQKRLLVGILPVLVAVAYWQFMYSPRKVEIADLQDHYDQLDAKNRGTEAIIKQYGGNLTQQLAIYQEHLAAIEKLVPSRNDIPALLVAMGEQAQNHNVRWGGFTPAPEADGEYYSKQTYEITVLGEYHDVGSYLAAVGSLPRIVKPTELKLTVENQEGRDDALPPVLRGVFRVETYVLPAPGEVRADSSAAASKGTQP